MFVQLKTRPTPTESSPSVSGERLAKVCRRPPGSVGRRVLDVGLRLALGAHSVAVGLDLCGTESDRDAVCSSQVKARFVTRASGLPAVLVGPTWSGCHDIGDFTGDGVAPVIW